MTDLVDMVAQLEEADRQRDRGMALAAHAEGPDFATAAYMAIRAVALRQITVHVDDVRRQCLLQPAHPNAFGAVWMRAIREGLIAPTGQRRKSTDPKKHAHQYPVYASLIVRAPTGHQISG